MGNGPSCNRLDQPQFIGVFADCCACLSSYCYLFCQTLIPPTLAVFYSRPPCINLLQDHVGQRDCIRNCGFNRRRTPPFVSEQLACSKNARGNQQDTFSALIHPNTLSCSLFVLHYYGLLSVTGKSITLQSVQFWRWYNQLETAARYLSCDVLCPTFSVFSNSLSPRLQRCTPQSVVPPFDSAYWDPSVFFVPNRDDRRGKRAAYRPSVYGIAVRWGLLGGSQLP
jgi:hypothetical protein